MIMLISDRYSPPLMIRKYTAVAARQKFGDLLEQVQCGNDSVLITKDGEPVAALVNVQLFERIRRGRDDFQTLTEVLGQSYAGVDLAIAETEIAEAVLAAGRRNVAAKAARKRR